MTFIEWLKRPTCRHTDRYYQDCPACQAAMAGVYEARERLRREDGPYARVDVWPADRARPLLWPLRHGWRPMLRWWWIRARRRLGFGPHYEVKFHLIHSERFEKIEQELAPMDYPKSKLVPQVQEDTKEKS